MTRSAYAIRSPSQRDEVFGTHNQQPVYSRNEIVNHEKVNRGAESAS